MAVGDGVGDGEGRTPFAAFAVFALPVVAGSVDDPPPPHAASAMMAKVAKSVRMERILHEERESARESALCPRVAGRCASNRSPWPTSALNAPQPTARVPMAAGARIH
jgi:hypothetical protein